MPPEFAGKWGTECLSTKFPLPTLLCAGYSVKLIFFIYITFISPLILLYVSEIHLNNNSISHIYLNSFKQIDAYRYTYFIAVVI